MDLDKGNEQRKGLLELGDLLLGERISLLCLCQCCAAMGSEAAVMFCRAGYGNMRTGQRGVHTPC
jgi:hypothetical protein